MSEATPFDPTKPYPWPRLPGGKPVKWADIREQVRATLKNKPARDKAARDALGPPKVPDHPAIAKAAASATPFSQTAKAAAEVKPGA